MRGCLDVPWIGKGTDDSISDDRRSLNPGPPTPKQWYLVHSYVRALELLVGTVKIEGSSPK